jgi:alkylation response protein AidB-like acyl-CoA dehydrogenase
MGPRLTRSMLFSRAKSIWGGSNEIQHNVIAKHVLGL